MASMMSGVSMFALAACSQATVAPGITQTQPGRDGGQGVITAGMLQRPSAETSATGTQPPVAPQPPPAPPPPPLPAKVKVTVKTSPTKAKAKVFWGKKLLGVTPFWFERDRGSGPMDLVLRSDGYFPVHIRAYTDRNDTLTVDMTKLADRMTLYGAKQELPPATTPATPGDGTPPGAVPVPPAMGGAPGTPPATGTQPAPVAPAAPGTQPAPVAPTAPKPR